MADAIFVERYDRKISWLLVSRWGRCSVIYIQRCPAILIIVRFRPAFFSVFGNSESRKVGNWALLLPEVGPLPFSEVPVTPSSGGWRKWISDTITLNNNIACKNQGWLIKIEFKKDSDLRKAFTRIQGAARTRCMISNSRPQLAKAFV